MSDQYHAQIQTGMNIYSVRYCMFSQFLFRRCKLGTFITSTLYDWAYHKEWDRKINCKPIGFGYLHWEEDCELLDLGSVDNILEYTKGGKYKIILNEKTEFNKGKVLMFKIFDIKYDHIIPDKNFLNDKGEILWTKYKELREKLDKKNTE